MHVLTAAELDALLWLRDNSPVHSFKKKDPSIALLRLLVSKRLAKTRVVEHAKLRRYIVTNFLITKKGVRYCIKLG